MTFTARANFHVDYMNYLVSAVILSDVHCVSEKKMSVT